MTQTSNHAVHTQTKMICCPLSWEIVVHLPEISINDSTIWIIASWFELMTYIFLFIIWVSTWIRISCVGWYFFAMVWFFFYARTDKVLSNHIIKLWALIPTCFLVCANEICALKMTRLVMPLEALTQTSHRCHQPPKVDSVDIEHGRYFIRTQHPENKNLSLDRLNKINDIFFM